MAEAYLALGANLGHPQHQLSEARQKLADAGLHITGASSLYRTPPFGIVEQPAFFNQCLLIETTLSPHALLELCLGIERQMGRERTVRWGPRAIDIDLLDYDHVVISDERLTLPHPGLMQRAFVLVPLVEIAPELAIGGARLSDCLAILDQAGIERVGSSSL